MADYINVLNRAVSLDTAPAFQPFTGVRLWYDDEHFYFAGDETGRVLEQDQPWATQAMADSILASIRGFAYQPFEAGAAQLDMEAELGDGVNVGGVYSLLAEVNTTFGAMCASDLSAPSEEEVNHEYPYKPKQQRQMERNFKRVYSEIEKTAEEIRLSVNEVNGKYTALSVTLDGVTVTDAGGTTRIMGSSIETSTLYVDAAHINGTLTADQIQTDHLHVNAANIDGTLTADQVQLTDSISWADLDSGVQSSISNAGGYSKSQIKTFINESLVASPNIAGATFYDLPDSGDLSDSMAYLRLHEEEYGNKVGPVLRYVDNQNGHDIFRLWSWNKHCYMGLCGGFGWVCSPNEIDEDADGLDCQVYTALGTHAFRDKVRFDYKVEFSEGCTVTGLTQTYVPVWG